MSSSTLDPKATPAGAGGEQTPAEGAKPARRYRRPVSRAKKAAAMTETTPTTATAGQNETAQAPQAELAPPAESPAAEQRLAEQAAQAPQAETRARGAARSQRGQRGERRGTGRKGSVQLVIPANGAAENAPQEATEQAERQEPVASAEPRMVPVVTHTPVAEKPAPAGETAAPAAPAEAAAATPQAGPARRYRFERRPSSATAPAAAIRPERLASQQTLPAASAISQPAEAEQRAEPEAVLQAPSTEQRETAEPHVTPPAPAAKAPDLFGARTLTEPLHADAVTSDAVDDIVAALGLRGAKPRRAEPQPVEEAIPSPAPEVVSEEGAEAEEAGEQAEEAHAGGEGQPSARRRRRRRRSSPHAAHEAEEGEEQPTGEASEMLATLTQPTETSEERATRNGAERYGDFGPFEQPYAPYTPGKGYTSYGRATREQPAAQQPWDIGEAQGQIRQSESPFGAPEPSFARGFGPQPRGVAGPAREFYPRTGRTERTEATPISPNQVGSMVTQAIQQQTDRLLAELRHQQMPPSMTVMFPPFPSTERVGVFVDVANVLYSSRSMRVSLDFGRLLDFLRGNRRLTRAHAYAPTNPDPNAEQSFLSVVKGLGYRITTKNYKTFSSGAKKADLDLDMCMDIVRLVDSGAVDTIVLVSGDSDFLPLLEYCSDKGVRVEVAAFDDSAAMILRQSCDLFINLSLVDDIRA